MRRRHCNCSQIMCTTCRYIYKIFSLARRAAGLSLNVTKCVLVPLSHAISPHIISCMRDFLRANTPEWATFNITHSAKYLGVWLGTGANVKHWIKTNSDYNFRVNAISNAGVASSLAVEAYNVKCVSKYSYLGQFLPPRATSGNQRNTYLLNFLNCLIIRFHMWSLFLLAKLVSKPSAH